MKLDQLTFTRYIAALTVVFFHFGQSIFPANIPLLQPLITAGPIAVGYFFVLSGFIMAVAYYKPSSESNLNNSKYWLARFARVYPVYFLALFIMLADAWRKSEFDAITTLLNLTMLQAWVPGGYPLSLNSPGWSLSVEAAFYLSFPLWLLLAKRFALSYLLIASLVLWALTQLLQIGLLNNMINTMLNLPIYEARAFMQDHQLTPPLHDFIYYHPLMHLNTFVLGFVVGVYFCRGHFHNKLSVNTNTLLLVVSSLLTALLILFQEPIQDWLGIKFAYNNGLLAPFFIAFIIFLALDNTIISRLLSLPILILLGEASYSLYILQRPLYGIYKQVTLQWQWLSNQNTLHFYLFIVILTFVAVLSYRFFESPLRRFINSWHGLSGKTSQY